jgi:hypothetical protein
MPASRYVRLTRSSPSLSGVRRGSATSAHIGRISRGGPGSATTTRPSGRVTNQPGAVPFGFGSAVADGMSHACFRLISGNRRLRRAQSSRSQRSIPASTAGSSPHAAAIDSRVRSSGVGPRPPVETTRSTRPRASAYARLTVARSSRSAVIRTTCTPSAVSDRASSPAFVSRVSPTVSSVPMLSTSAVRRRRGSEGGLMDAERTAAARQM